MPHCSFYPFYARGLVSTANDWNATQIIINDENATKKYFNDKNARTPKNYKNNENATLFLPQPLKIMKMTKMPHFFHDVFLPIYERGLVFNWVLLEDSS